MKTIIRKELRENFKLAVIGFAVLTFMFVQGYRSCHEFFTQLALGQSAWQTMNAQPLLSEGVLAETAYFCAIFGAVLGWLQIFSERHRDLRAFLVHRPISRSEIFFGKVIAGLCLYAAGAGLPLLGYIVIAWIPGHFPVPFTWPMVLPLASYFLCGTVFYFGGMLTGLRQARWYASRGLGLAAGILLAVFSARAPDFWRVLVFLVPGVLIVGTAAWGNFISGGYYEGQPAAGRRALVLSLMVGCYVVLSLAFALLWTFVYSPNYFMASTSYSFGKDGTIYKTYSAPGKPEAITDLNGKTLLDKTTGQPMRRNDFYKILAQGSAVYPDFDTNPPPPYNSNGGFNSSVNYFYLWRQTLDTLWYWCPNGRLWAYDMASRRFIGSMGPDGFTPGVSTGSDRFRRMEGPFMTGYYSQWYPGQTLLTDTAVYQLDYDNRTSKAFFTTTNNERIGGAVDVSMDNNAWNYTVVVTKDSVRVLTPDGKIATQFPYQPKYPSYYTDISVSFLEPTNNFVFQFYPSYRSNELSNWKLPIHVVWVAGGQGVVKSLDLPSTERTWHAPFLNRLPDMVIDPPVSYLMDPIASWRSFYSPLLIVKDPSFWLSVVAAVICAGAGWRLGRRYYFTTKTQMKWAVFNLLFGPAGLLAFICALEWPARVLCPHCKKPRMVDREHCEHCGETFPPPPKIGTEIFEPVVAETTAH
jgi:ABC-type transport system involved in multi-copper enzyme maturation permease subunit